MSHPIYPAYSFTLSEGENKWFCHIPSPLLLIDSNGNCLEATDLCLLLTKLERPQLVRTHEGQPPISFPHPIQPGIATGRIEIGPRMGDFISCNIAGLEGNPVIYWVSVGEASPSVSQHASLDDRQSNLMLREIINNFPNGTVSILDRDLRFLDIGGSTLKKHGIDPQSLLGVNVSDVLVPEERAFVMPYYERALQGEELEFEFNYKDQFQYLFSCGPVYGVNGEVNGIFVVNRDVTDLKQKEGRIRELSLSLERQVMERTAQLHESHKQYKSLYDHTPVMLVTITAETGSILFTNKRFEENLGYREGEIKGFSMVDLMKEESQIHWHDAMQIYDKTGEFPDWEFVFLTRSNREILVKGIVRPMDQDADSPSALNIMWQDVTSQKEAVIALQESEFRFRMLGHSIPSLVWMSDSQGKRTFFSQAWEPFSGISTEQLQEGEWLHLIHPDDQSQYILKQEEAHHLKTSFEWEYRLKTTTGQFHWVSGKAQPRVNTMGHFEGLIGAETDIQLLKNVEKKLHSMTRLLQASDSELAELSFFLTQDIHKSVQEVDQYAKLLSEQITGVGEKAFTLVDTIIQKNRLLGDTILEVLAFSRVNRAALHKVWLDPSVVFKNVVDQKAKEYGLEGQIEVVSEAQLAANGDPTLIQLLMEVIVTNSIQFRDPGRGLKLVMGTTQAGGNHVFFIRDNGKGFESKEAGAVFEPFYRGVSVGSNSGLGLGLSIAKRIVERHNGLIWAEGRPGKGALIYFSLKG